VGSTPTPGTIFFNVYAVIEARLKNPRSKQFRKIRLTFAYLVLIAGERLLLNAVGR